MISHAGHTISYDALGNPLNWYSGNKTFSNITWEGRRLTGMTVGSTAYTYSYNSDGIRTKKQNGSNVVEYLYDDAGNLVEEKHSGYSLYFIYDDSNELIGFKVSNGGTYYYGKDIFGVIKYIYNASGTIVGTYTYDAWGNIISSTGTTDTNLNPIRYKDYYYDTESGFYYLQSRYYDPQVGRFISADDTGYLGATGELQSYNLYTYCENNAVNKVDKYGCASGYIDNQNDPKWQKYAVGFWGNVCDNGCGAIAIYNVLYSYSSKITINKVLSDLRWKYGSIIWNNIGRIGISPTSVTKYLASKFWFKYTAGPITYLWGIKAELSGAIIVLYQGKGWNAPLHYVAGIKTGEGYGGSFRFYNCSLYRNNYKTKSISIWKFIDLLKDNGCKVLMFWGVAGKLGW